MNDPGTQREPVDAAHRAVAYARKQAARAFNAPLVPTGPPGYTLVRRIHQGGQGTVYEALHDATGRQVAIKIMHAGIGHSAYNEARFQREIEILSELRHPHIVTLHDGGATPSHHYFLVMDYVDGLPLDAWIRSHEPDVRETVELFEKICAALAAAHLRGVVHRDLKPSNIRVDRNGAPRVLDFGLAKMSGAQVHGDMTASGQFIGSLPWATPEQAMGRPERIDVRTDVYALGLVLFNMLTDDAPYPVDGPVRDVLNNVLETTPAHPNKLRLGISTDLDTIIMKCLAKEPARRYLSAGELAADIGCYLRGDAIAARRDSALYIVKKLVGRHRWLTAATVGLVALSVITAITTTVLLRRANSAESEARDMAAFAADRAEHALESLRFLVAEVATELRHKPRTVALRKRILNGAYERMNQLSEEETDNPVFWRQRARAHAGLGEIAMDFHDLESAHIHFDKSAELRRRLVGLDSVTPDDEADLSISLVQLGDVQGRESNHSAKFELYEQALAIDEDLATRYPDNNHFLDNLVWSYDRIGAYYRSLGQVVEGKTYHQKQAELAQHLVDREPTNALRWFGLSIAHEQLLTVCKLEDDPAGAADHCAASIAAITRAIELDPEHSLYLRRACTVYVNAARILGMARRDELTDRALHIAHTLLATDPDHPENSLVYGSACSQIASQATAEDSTKAENYYHKAITAFEHCLSVAPDHDICAARLFHAWSGVADVLNTLSGKRYEQARSDVLRVLRSAIDDNRVTDRILITACQIASFLPFDDQAEMQTLLEDTIAAHGAIVNPQHVALIGRAYQQLGRCDLAVPLARQARAELDASSVTDRRDAERILIECGETAVD